MREVLAAWVSDADAAHYAQQLGLSDAPPELSYLRDRRGDYYVSLVGELFQRLREPYEDPADWSRLGNAIALNAPVDGDAAGSGVDGVLPSEVALFAAAAFYFGGFPASAYLMLKASDVADVTGGHRACYELLARPSSIESDPVRALVGALRRGDLQAIRDETANAARLEEAALERGPDEWVGWRLFHRVISAFETTNVRAVLPNGADDGWNPLIRSLLSRSPPVWDFFPSQIDAISSGLLGAESSYSIQMPTGAGKTALSETLLFHHLRTRPHDAAVLLVPYRSLASELRRTLVRRLNQIGITTGCAYGGTVPVASEADSLDDTQALVATPETLSGLLSANQEFLSRVSLVICDEGHLLDGQARGVSLELLLARMRAREDGPPRFVFVSAIVPNIEEINAWLGGHDETVVRSDYRPAVAEFSVLRPSEAEPTAVSLEFHPHESDSVRFELERFLSREDFRYRNPTTGRLRTYPNGSIKTKAVATARKALPLGAVAVFAANKRGSQGAVGLAEELTRQVSYPLSLPAPAQYVADAARLQATVEYLILEYGPSWVGTRALEVGVVLHHGDIPQESREVMERLVRDGTVRLAVCTNTLAEGVNLPIRTLVLYSVQRRRPDGATENLLSRDIKNLVGRAGRAGATTKGLVVCANPGQWGLIEPVARQAPGERVEGALLELMRRLERVVRQQHLTLTNDILENSPELHTLVDGIDATLIDLASEELAEQELARIARDLASETFAARRAAPETTALMHEVFELRAARIFGLRQAGRIQWIREAGARARMLDSVETDLLPLRDAWDDIASPTDPELLDALLTWAWELPDMKDAISETYRDLSPSREAFAMVVSQWIEGRPLVQISSEAELDIDMMLGVHSRVISFVLQVAVEQGVGLLRKLCGANGGELAQAVIDLPEHLRFGVPTAVARILALGGVRHRRAAVSLGRAPELVGAETGQLSALATTALTLLADEERWLPSLGRLVLEHTREDLEQLQGLRADGE